MTFDDIQVGSTVTVSTPQGQTRKGRAVMFNKPAQAWVLNGGGRHGTPIVARPENFISTRRPRGWRQTN